MTKVLVVSGPISDPARPVRGMFSPFRAGWSLTSSGVSPWATCHLMSPLARSIAVIRPHGGLIIGSPLDSEDPRADAVAFGRDAADVHVFEVRSLRVCVLDRHHYVGFCL